MKNGTEYARKLKQVYARLKQPATGRVADHTDPIEQLIIAVLSQETTQSRAERAFKQINSGMVDLNELRVSTPAEVSDCITQHVPRSVQRAKVLVQVLNAIYAREYKVSLESLRGKGVREIKAYFDSLAGVTPYVAASVILWSLGGHAVPVNDVALDWLNKNGLVHPSASAAEVQAFLERHISATDAKSFCLNLEALASSRTSLAADDGKGTASSRASAKTRSRAVTKTKSARSRNPASR